MDAHEKALGGVILFLCLILVCVTEQEPDIKPEQVAKVDCSYGSPKDLEECQIKIAVVE